MKTISVQIGNREIGPGKPSFIIAEVSANHRGDINTALQAIDAAKYAGADAVKFQHLRHKMIAAEPLSAFYKSAELPYEWTQQLVARAKEKNIIFLSTPFDTEAIDILDAAETPAFKVASYEMTDDILLAYMAKKGRPIILSTGMAYLEEVKHAVEVIEKAGNDKIIVLHCTSLYPPQAKDLNLKAIQTLSQALNRPIGYSDHSHPSSNAATLGAIALGACLIERHITDSQEGNSNDDKNSMTIDQFKHMVEEVRELEAAMSRSGVKEPVSDPSREVDEVKERGTRRSLYAAADIKEGEIITEKMLITLRPMSGIEPKDLSKVIGKKALRSISARSPITQNDVNI